MPNTPLRVGGRAFEALIHEALRCACDTAEVPLCVRCECLFRLAVAATDYALTAGRARHREDTPHA